MFWRYLRRGWKVFQGVSILAIMWQSGVKELLEQLSAEHPMLNDFRRQCDETIRDARGD